MSQNSGPFLASSHGYPSFNPRLLSSSSLSPSLKRPGNGPMSIGNLPNTTLGPNMNVSPLPATMRPSNSMGPMKPSTVGMNPMDKSNSMPYSSRYTRKVWPMTRSIHDKSIRGHDDHESPYLRSGLPPDSISSSSFTIEPSADDDDGDDIFFSSRQMAAARFQRNQRLLSEIFNEVCIPDLRSNVTVDRILTLRRQVDALKTHRDTFDKDLNESEEKHAVKKRRFSEANEKFHTEYAEASSTNLSEEKINEILQKYETMEKLQKEKQLLLQQQQQAGTAPPLQPPPSITITTAAVSESNISVATKTEPVSAVEVSQQQTATPPPPPVQPPVPPAQFVPAPLPSSQPVPSPLPPFQPAPTQLPPSQPVATQLPSSQSVPSQVPPSQHVQHQLPPPVMQQVLPPPPVMQQVLPPPPPQQQQQQQQLPQPQQTHQGYPTMHSGASYGPAPGYGHPQQTQYRPSMTQRPASYPSNAQWQQQQQQQWQTNTYDPRYYNPYPSNVQWSQQQQQQQWSPNQPQQQQMAIVSHQQQAQMRAPPQQQSQMYGNGAHYGYGGAPAGWNTGAHPSQQYGYPQNPSYDPSPSQQQYYSQPQMHNPPQGYDYGPPPSQQQQMPPQQPPPPPPPPSMN